MCTSVIRCLTSSYTGDINIDNYVYAVTVSPSGRFIAGILRSSGGKFIIIWDSQTKTTLAKIMAVRALAFIPSRHGPEAYILVVMEQSLVVWDHFCGARVALLAGSSVVNGDDPWPWEADVGKNFLCVWGRNGTLLVWETQSFGLVHTYRHHPPVLSNPPYFDKNSVYMSHDEKWLIVHNTPHWTYKISVWDTVTWTLHATFPHHDVRRDILAHQALSSEPGSLEERG